MFDFLTICKNLTPDRKELIARFFAVFLNLIPERSAPIDRFWSIVTNLILEIVARKQVAVKVYTVTEIITIRSFKLRKGIKRKVLYFWRDQLEENSGLLTKMTLQVTNTADLQLRQHTGEPNSPRNQLAKTEANVVSGRSSGESVIEYLSSNSSIDQKYMTRISFYSYLAAEFTKYLGPYRWSVYILFLCV